MAGKSPRYAATAKTAGLRLQAQVGIRHGAVVENGLS